MERCTINIQQGDCMDALRGMNDNSFDLAIVDPPYAVGASGGYFGGQKNSTKRRSKKEVVAKKHYKNANETPDEEYFAELFRVSKNQIVWGSNYYPMHMPKSGAIIWDKKNDNNPVLSDAEIAFQSFSNKVNIYRFTWSGLIRDNGAFEYSGNQVIHPNQKPVALYKWLLQNYAKEGDKILDTHLGSGSIAIACWDMKFDLTGFELDEDYYKSAMERLKNHQSQGQLF